MGKINDLEAALNNKNVNQMLNLLAYTEGTDRLHGYNTLVGGKKLDDLSQHPNVVGLTTKDGASTAFGRYQITGSTWRGLKNQYGFTDFSPKTQDLAAVALMKSRGALTDVVKGDFSSAIGKLGSEWVSLPTSTTKNQPSKSWGDVSKFLGQDVGNNKSTFDRVVESNQPPKNRIANVYAAYKAGKMSPQDKVEFEKDVTDGLVMLPRGASLDTPKQADGIVGDGVAPKGVLQAYLNGRMSPEDKMEFEQDVQDGLIKVPNGFKLQPPKETGLIDTISNVITGNDRKTSESEMFPDWETMPELNNLSWGSFKTGVGTFISSPQESMQILKTNYPNVEVKQDSKGNYLVRSSMDGKWYSSKPGLTAADVVKAGTTAAATLAATPAALLARAGTSALGAAGLGVAGGAASQAGIEGIQAATGGSFDPADIAIAGALGGAVPAVVGAVKASKAPLTNVLNKARGVPPQQAAPIPQPPTTAAPTMQMPAGAAIPSTIPTKARAVPTPEPTPVMGTVEPMAPPQEFLDAEKLTETAKQASTGTFTGKAKETLAGQAAPDPEVLAAAQRLGIEDYLQPDHVTTNQAYRELAQAVKSVPGSTARASELEGLQEVVKRADDIIEKIGGSNDLSTLDFNIKNILVDTQNSLRAQAKKFYDQVDRAVRLPTEIQAPNIEAYIKKRVADLGGVDGLELGEKQAIKLLKIGKKANPTYGGLDSLRKRINAVKFGSTGAFAETTDTTRNDLLNAMRADQKEVAINYGVGDVWELAQASSRAKKSVQSDLQALFGKELNKSFIPDLATATKALPKGDASKFIELIKAIPNDQRKEVVAGGLLSAFGKNAKNGALNFTTYSDWFEGLQRNKQSYAAIMSNLPPESVAQLKDLYKVSKGISLATKERITTGRIMAVQEQFKNADTMMSNIYQIAKRSTIGVAAEAITTPLGSPGVGIASGLTAALSKNRTKAIEAADKLIASSEFMGLVRTVNMGVDPKKLLKSPETKQAIHKMARSQSFVNFMRSVKKEGYKEQSKRVQFLTSLLITSTVKNKDENPK